MRKGLKNGTINELDGFIPNNMNEGLVCCCFFWSVGANHFFLHGLGAFTISCWVPRGWVKRERDSFTVWLLDAAAPRLQVKRALWLAPQLRNHSAHDQSEKQTNKQKPR